MRKAVLAIEEAKSVKILLSMPSSYSIKAPSKKIFGLKQFTTTVARGASGN